MLLNTWFSKRADDRRSAFSRTLSTMVLFVVSCALLGGTYVVSVVWRVSLVEHNLLGSSQLIRFPNARKYADAPNNGSMWSKTYTVDVGGRPIIVWGEKLNGFQHAYGSALAAYELGDWCADKLFVANEFVEWFLDHNGVSTADLLDRRRDMANNAVGRRVGIDARNHGLWGSAADEYIQAHLLKEMEIDRTIVVHPFHIQSFQLPSEEQLGLVGLPRRNGYDVMFKMLTKARNAKRVCIKKLRKMIPRQVSDPTSWSQTS